MRADEVRARVRARVAEAAELPIEQIASSLNLTADLAIDSLDLLQLAGELEDEFQLPDSTDDDLGEIKTVGDIERHVLDLLPDVAGEDLCAS
jgi:acyl carrier protein